MAYIKEVIVTTTNLNGDVKISPLGIHVISKSEIHIKPFKPSRTLNNLKECPYGVINYISDIKIFASCILREELDLKKVKAEKIKGYRLKKALAHSEFKVIKVQEDEIRPTFICKILHEENHEMYKGYNRAQNSILEMCILVSRLGIIDINKINKEMNYLRIAVEKTANKDDLIIWEKLKEKIDKFEA